MIDIKQQIKEFVESFEQELALDFQPLDTFDELFRELGFKSFDNIEINGWAIDFWRHYVHPEYGKYYIEGSLYYGNFMLIKAD